MKPTVALLTAFVLLSSSSGLRGGEEDELHARLEALEQKARAARDAGQLDLLEKLRAEMQQVKQGSPETEREALTETLQNLENKAREYKARLAEAEKSDQPDQRVMRERLDDLGKQATEVRARLQKLDTAVAGKQAKEGEEVAAQQIKRLAKLIKWQEMLGKAQAELAEAEKNGREEAAAEARARIHKLRAALAEESTEGKESEDRPVKERKLAARFEELKAMVGKTQAELAEAEKSGRKDAAEDARARLQKLKLAIADESRQAKPEEVRERPDEPRGEAPARREQAQGRRDHLRQAIEHLHAAGMHDAAERLAREFPRLEGARPARIEGPRRPEGEPRPEGDRRPEADRRPESDRRPDGSPRPEGDRRPSDDQRAEGDRGEIQELRQGLRSLQGQIEQLHRRLQELSERGR